MTNEVVITAVICSYNRYRTIGPAIDSLESQSLSREKYEIIVVDNSPDHEFSATFGQRFSGIQNLTWVIEKIPGLSNARNVGTRLAKGRYVAFMDDDAVAESTWLERLIAAFEEFGDRTAVVGGRVDPIWDSPRPSWLPDEFLGHLSVVNWGGMTRIAGEREWLAGTNIAFRVEALNRIGGFSVHLGRTGAGHALLSNEESDVCQKLRSVGDHVVYCPEAKVGHRVEIERLTQEWFRRRVVWQAISDYFQSGPKLFDEAGRYWKGVFQFVNALPPRDRSPRAFYVPLDDAKMFGAQLAALYNYTIALLTGFKGVED
jgi:glycosyltransferase involved in cell wall biosynthesis